MASDWCVGYVQNIWWAPLTWLLIPLHLSLNVVLGVQEDADGSLKFTFQEDHIFWVESLLELNPVMTLGLGPFFMRYVRPIAGVLRNAIVLVTCNILQAKRLTACTEHAQHCYCCKVTE